MKLDVSHINKSFGEKLILDDVTFSIKSGQAMGFLGRNGAGKTTTIRALMGVFNADKGSFLLDGEPFIPTNHRVGYLPEERGMYDKISILQQLVYFGELKNMKRSDAVKSAKYWLKRFELDSYENKKLEVLSKGNQQKIQIIQTIIHDPEILILDEPFSGLDPVNSQILKEVISEFITKERILIFSSHQMGYVEEFCDEVTFIDKGKIIISDNLKTMKKDIGNNRLRLLSSSHDTKSVKEILEKTIEKIQINEDIKSLIISMPSQMTRADLLSKIIEQKIEVELFSVYEPTLEDIFIGKVGDEI